MGCQVSTCQKTQQFYSYKKSKFNNCTYSSSVHFATHVIYYYYYYMILNDLQKMHTRVQLTLQHTFNTIILNSLVLQ